jgi:hypothetical protein
MRNLFILVLVIAALIAGGLWAQKHLFHDRNYAPREAEDSDLSIQPASEPAPPPAPPPPEQHFEPTATLPSAPIPYDQLNKTDGAAAVPGEPPKNNSNDKAIFY